MLSIPLHQLWCTPLNNGINKTQTQLRSLNVSEYKNSAIFKLYKVNGVKFCNNQGQYNIPFHSLNPNIILVVIYFHRPITTNKYNLLQRIIREVRFKFTIYQSRIYITIIQIITTIHIFPYLITYLRRQVILI